MRPRLGHVLVLGALVCGLAVAAAAEVDSYARIVRLSYVDGQVQMSRDGSSPLETGFLNMPLAQGSQVATGADGFAEIEFENGSTMRLTPLSSLRMTELGSRGDSRVSLVDLDSGTVYFDIKGDSDDDFRVLLQGQEVRVQKSARFRIRLARDTAQVAVMKGELQFAGDNQVTVRKDETLTLDFQDRGRYFLAKNIETLLSDAWDRERDQYRVQYASNRYGSSRYAYGASDLNYYGSFVNISGYGNCWRPYGYGASWDPFLDGAWVWYPRWGYVWVSSYPWGWTPYRYGQWTWVSGYNWCWQPGSYWSSWSYYPVVYHWPSWYDRRRGHPPGRQPHSGGSPVVVVGRGPYQGGGGGRDGRRPNVDGTGGQGGGVVVSGGGSGGSPPSRGGITPGVMPPEATETLRRVHGDQASVRDSRRRMVEADVNEGSGSGATVTPAGGNSASSGGAAATPVATPPEQVVTPVPPERRDDGGRGNAVDGAEVQQPRTMPRQQQQQPTPVAPTPTVQPASPPSVQPVRPSTPPSSGNSGNSASSASSYRSSGGNSGGSSGGSAPRSSGGSSASSGSGYRSSGSSSSSSGGSRSTSSGSSSGGSRSSGSGNRSPSTKSPK